MHTRRGGLAAGPAIERGGKGVRARERESESGGRGAYDPTPMPQPPSAPSKCRASEAVTHGFRVTVAPSYRPEESGESTTEAWRGRRYVFAYQIKISNEGARRAQLLGRHWTIVDADGEAHEVRGEGVVGHQPTLAPGQAFEYSSYCPLATPWGTMEGKYLMEGEDGERFEIDVGRFYLVAEE